METWSELPFDQFANEVAALAERSGDQILARKVEAFRADPDEGARDSIIDWMEEHH